MGQKGNKGPLFVKFDNLVGKNQQFIIFYNVKPSFLVRTPGYDLCQTQGHFRLQITSLFASEFEQVLVPKNCLKIQIRTCLNNDVSEKIKLGGGKGSGRLGGFGGWHKRVCFCFLMLRSSNFM